MLTWSCEQVRAELSAFYDEELPVTDRIAISDHLDGCPSCRLEADDLELIGDALQATARVEDVAVMPGLNRLQTDILERWNAEERASLGRTIRQSLRRPAPRIRQRERIGGRLAVSRDGAFVLAQSPIRHPESLKAAMTLSSRARTADIYLPAGRNAAARPCRSHHAGDGDEPRRRRGGIRRARDGRWVSRGC